MKPGRRLYLKHRQYYKGLTPALSAVIDHCMHLMQ